MKKILYILPVLLLLAGCSEKEFTTSVDNEINSDEYRVNTITNIDRVVYNNVDSSLVIEATFDNADAINAVWAEVYDPDNNRLNDEPVYLYDDGKPEHGDAHSGDNSYANLFYMSSDYANGEYLIEYFVQEIYMNNLRKVSVQTFTFDNGQTNIAPVVSNLTAPDTARIDSEDEVLVLPFTLRVDDENGMSDIEAVYMDLFNRDETEPLTRLALKDDGNNAPGGSGDEVAGDGIYTVTLQVDSENQTSSYRMEFAARDRGKKISNIITHYFEIIIDL